MAFVHLHAADHLVERYILRVMKNFGTLFKPPKNNGDLIFKIDADKELACADTLWVNCDKDKLIQIICTDSEEILAMLNEPKTTARIAARFKRVNRHYEDPLFARGACSAVSHNFVQALHRAGISHATTAFWAHEGAMHEWSRVGRIVIDWTYRQFDHACSFPHIYVDTSIPKLVRPLP